MSAWDSLQAMTDAIGYMTNLIKFTMGWKDVAITPSTTLHFLEATRKPFTSSLRKLTLRGHISCFRGLLETVQITGLEELKLHFDRDEGKTNLTEKKATAEGVLVTCVAPFINGCRSSLSVLSIISEAKYDLSSFFGALTYFPRLSILALHFRFDPVYLSNVSGLEDLLIKHSESLSRVEMISPRSSYCNFSADSGSSKSGAYRFQDSAVWTITPKCELIRGVFFRCLSQSARPITALRLVDCCLTLEEITTLAGLLSCRLAQGGLQYLHIEPQDTIHICDILDVLASKLPGLASLDIVYESLWSPVRCISLIASD